MTILVAVALLLNMILIHIEWKRIENLEKWVNYFVRLTNGFWEEDIVCDYWVSDGLTADDFCSYGEREGE